MAKVLAHGCQHAMQVPLGAACQHNLGHEGLWQVSQLMRGLLLLLEWWW